MTGEKGAHKCKTLRRHKMHQKCRGYGNSSRVDISHHNEGKRCRQDKQWELGPQKRERKRKTIRRDRCTVLQSRQAEAESTEVLLSFILLSVSRSRSDTSRQQLRQLFSVNGS